METRKLSKNLRAKNLAKGQEEPETKQEPVVSEVSESVQSKGFFGVFSGIFGRSEKET